MGRGALYLAFCLQRFVANVCPYKGGENKPNAEVLSECLRGEKEAVGTRNGMKLKSER